jgi:glycosyltransferase involved in cell wall biosynthesis
METVIRTLVAAMPGQDVRIFCCDGADDHGALEVTSIPQGRDRRRMLLETLRVFQPDLVEHHQQVKQALFLARAMPEAAHVLYRHNALKAPRTPFDAWRYGARYSTMDGIIFVSEAERAAFARAYPSLAERAWAVPNPIDTRPWLAPPEAREPVIAFAGRAMPQKGLAVICAALPTILDRHPAWRSVLMLGDWSHHHQWAAPHVEALARYGSRVTVLRSAPLGEVQRQMKTAAIALTPSMWEEPFGLTAVEAHAAGAALISSGRGGLREASGPYAHYLNAVTPQTLIAAIEHLILRPDHRVALAKAAQRHVVDVHAPRIRAAELLRIRQAVVERRRLAM